MASYVVPSPVPQTPSIHYISPEPDNPPVLQASLYLFQTVAPPFCTSYLVTLLPEPVIEHFPATFPTHAASSQGLETHPVLDFLGQVLMNSLLYSLLCKTLFSWESVDGGFFFITLLILVLILTNKTQNPEFTQVFLVYVVFIRKTYIILVREEI